MIQIGKSTFSQYEPSTWTCLDCLYEGRGVAVKFCSNCGIPADESRLEDKPPLTRIERKIMDNISRVWNGFKSLDPSHPNDLTEFHSAIHDLQKIIGMRVLRRSHPEIWPDHSNLSSEFILTGEKKPYKGSIIAKETTEEK
jgi:hypothetical protein